MLDYIQREKFTEIIISTPGPVGLTALLAAKMLNLQTSGIYHTDFPAIRPDSYRGQLPGKRRVALHALVLWPARHRFR